MMRKLLSELKNIKPINILMLLIAGIVNAFGVTLFLTPVKLFDSGLSGTSMLIEQLTPSYISLSIVLLLLNIPIFIYGFRKQGLLFTVYSIFTVGIYSLFAWLITDVLPIDVKTASPLAESDLLLCALFGGMVSGLGSGLTIRFGGAIDGIEVLAVIFAKKLNLSVGSFCMIYNVVLYVICGIVLKSWILPLYSVVTYMAALKTVDFIVDGLSKSKCAMIVTTKEHEITEALMSTFHSAPTIVTGMGGYSGTEKKILYFIVNRFQVTKMKELVKAIDPVVYISISEVSDVLSTRGK